MLWRCFGSSMTLDSVVDRILQLSAQRVIRLGHASLNVLGHEHLEVLGNSRRLLSAKPFLTSQRICHDSVNCIWRSD